MAGTRRWSTLASGDESRGTCSTTRSLIGEYERGSVALLRYPGATRSILFNEFWPTRGKNDVPLSLSLGPLECNPRLLASTWFDKLRPRGSRSMIHAGIAISVLPRAAEIARDPLEFVFIRSRGSANNRPITRNLAPPKSKRNVETRRTRLFLVTFLSG